MSEKTELKYNDFYTEIVKWNDISTLPDSIKINGRKVYFYIELIIGWIALLVYCVFSFIFNYELHFANIIGLILFSCIMSLAGIWKLNNRANNIILTKEHFIINKIKHNWIDISQIFKLTEHKSSILRSRNYLFIELRKKDDTIIKFSCEEQNYNVTDIEQLVYMFWRRGTKQKVN